MIHNWGGILEKLEKHFEDNDRKIVVNSPSCHGKFDYLLNLHKTKAHQSIP